MCADRNRTTRVTCPDCKFTDELGRFPDAEVPFDSTKQCPECERSIAGDCFMVAQYYTDWGQALDLRGPDGQGMVIPRYAAWGHNPFEPRSPTTIETSGSFHYGLSIHKKIPA